MTDVTVKCGFNPAKVDLRSKRRRGATPLPCSQLLSHDAAVGIVLTALAVGRGGKEVLPLLLMRCQTLDSDLLYLI